MDVQYSLSHWQVDSSGNENAINFNLPVQLAVFGEEQGLIKTIEVEESANGLSSSQNVQVVLEKKPAQIVIDHDYLLIDKDRRNNRKTL